MKKLILHIGHSKCASSTLQAYLCENLSIPVKGTDGNIYRYAAVLEDKKPLLAKRLKEASRQKATRYISSNMDISKEKSIQNSLTLLDSQCGKQDTVILSNEGWANPGLVTDETIKAFEACEVPIEIFMLIRPPVDWFNASWWQWGVWTGQDIESWYNSVGNINYLQSINRWSEIKNVVDIKIADISQEPIDSFLQFLALNLTVSQGEDVNKATNFELLKHLINNQQKYGRTLHDPSIEFQLNNLLELTKSQPPFITSAGMAKRIIQKNAKDYKALLQRTTWCRKPISDEVKRKYTDENYYDNIDSINFHSTLAAGYSDDFVGQLIDNIVQSRENSVEPMPLLHNGDADYLRDIANKIEQGLKPSADDAKALTMLAHRARPRK